MQQPRAHHWQVRSQSGLRCLCEHFVRCVVVNSVWPSGVSREAPGLPCGPLLPPDNPPAACLCTTEQRALMSPPKPRRYTADQHYPGNRLQTVQVGTYCPTGFPNVIAFKDGGVIKVSWRKGGRTPIALHPHRPQRKHMRPSRAFATDRHANLLHVRLRRKAHVFTLQGARQERGPVAPVRPSNARRAIMCTGLMSCHVLCGA